MLVLVADDDRAVRESLERALQFAGYEVELAADGDAALAAIERRTPDVVVLDVMMPGYDGLDVTRRLRREGNRLPILLLTAEYLPQEIAVLNLHVLLLKLLVGGRSELVAHDDVDDRRGDRHRRCDGECRRKRES